MDTEIEIDGIPQAIGRTSVASPILAEVTVESQIQDLKNKIDELRYDIISKLDSIESKLEH